MTEKVTGQDEEGNWGYVGEDGVYVGHPFTAMELAVIKSEKAYRAMLVAKNKHKDGDTEEALANEAKAITLSKEAMTEALEAQQRATGK